MFTQNLVRNRRLVFTCVLIVGAITLGACSRPNIHAPVDQRHVKATGGAPASYVVRGGDTVYAIAWRYNLDYRNIAVWNALATPYRIYPGQRLQLRKPKHLAKVQKKSRPADVNKPGVVNKRRTKKPKPKVATRDTPQEQSKPKSELKITWRRPTTGPVVRSFRQTRTGIDIAGRFGQTVRAAAMGRVVYSGSGLLGYGKLIILKHNTRFLTAYAHNSKILVSEGEHVSVGQPIATMGDTGTDRVMLHFEIRQAGKPVDPLRFIPNT